MMTRELQVSILAAPVAAMDRRSLSQAWYSALGFARRSAQSPATASAGARSSEDAAAKAHDASGGSTANPQPSLTMLRASSHARTHDFCSFDASRAHVMARARTPLGRAIEEAFSNRPELLRRATFSIGRGGARVHVILQTRGGVTALVALCSPAYSRQVSRALAEARLSLAARGFAADVRLREEWPCF
ncbi:MAG: hypothetical protein JO263_08590 [Candidatus Eremiobacteraeota bacterium]|nr:hypothetical protein [Candidatus Eremiobacteraeota bacterium]